MSIELEDNYSFLVAEAEAILYLQNWLGVNNPYLLRLSKFFNPTNFITVLFPVFASINTKLGFKFLLISTFSEWFTTLFKWALTEDRPYWWVLKNDVGIFLKQAELTCESSHGCPSAHVACTTAVCILFFSWLLDWLENTIESPNLKSIMKYFFIFVLSSIVALVALARMTLATNFPHQCLEGLILGIIFGIAFNYDFFPRSDNRWQLVFSDSRLTMTIVAILLSAMSTITFASIQYYEPDPDYAEKMALAYCYRTANVRVTTGALFFVVRDCACFCALGLASPIKDRKFYPTVGAIVTILFCTATRLLASLFPHNDPFQYYLFLYIETLYFSFCLLTVVPYIASLLRFKPKTE